jgi:hypothetical protein
MIKKVCGICNNPNKPIWKAKTRDNPCMCKDCYTAEKSSDKPPIKARVAIKKISDKQAKINVAYSALRLQYLKMFPNCQVVSTDCTYVATQIHHKMGRAKDHMLDTTTWLSICHSCHEKVELNPEWAYEKGYSIKRLNK